MENSIARPIDVHCKGLVPGADPYISQLVLLAEIEHQRRTKVNEQKVVTRQKRVSTCYGYSSLGGPLPPLKDPRYGRNVIRRDLA